MQRWQLISNGAISMKKFKLFMENFFVYGVGGIIGKIIPIVMVPLITRIMPNSEYYGISDMSNTIVQFGSAIAVIGMYDAMYRLFFEKEDIIYKKKICSTTFIFTTSMSILVFLLMIIMKNQLASFFLGNTKLGCVIYLTAMTTLVSATNSIISAPTRMQNKRIIYLLANTISPLIAYSISIPLLLKGHYLIALPLASLISGLMVEIFFVINNIKWFSLKYFDFNFLKQLLVIAIPLFPNFLIYWIFNSSDKLMITHLLGTSAVGIYSVGSKLGHCSQLIYTAFAGGWQYFAFSTMKEKNQVKSNSLIFEYLGIIAFVSSAFICSISFVLFKVLFTNDYLSGYIIAPYLFLGPLLQMLFNVACNQFLIIKKTWPNLFILLSGAIANIILNWILIPILGIEGAAIATVIGYILSDIICIIVLVRMKLMIISSRFCIASTIIVIYFILWRICFSDVLLISMSCFFILIGSYSVLYKKEIVECIRVISKFFNKKKKE